MYNVTVLDLLRDWRSRTYNQVFDLGKGGEGGTSHMQSEWFERAVRLVVGDISSGNGALVGIERASWVMLGAFHNAT